MLLASQSPRRRELLAQIGVPLDCVQVDVDESPLAGESPAAYVARLALAKARAGWQLAGRGPVLGSDTTVVCDRQILGKPMDEADCVATLMRLSGRTHQVLTAVALVDDERDAVEVVETEVAFRPLSEDECRRYWATGEPQDKAGSYGIQGLGAVFVAAINGSYSSVVGLPLQETATLLSQFGVDVWQQR
nr:Maf family protein [Motiliproteus sediminis]